MKKRLLALLACPTCRGDLDLVRPEESDGEIVSGALSCAPCAREYPIVRGIARFVPASNYAASFGYQWNAFKWEQVDSRNGTGLSRHRWESETGWDPRAMKGRWVLDAGCGAGRFLDVASTTEADVVGLDVSDAIDASAQVTKGRANVHLVQASIFEPPFKPGVFDDVYCIGVLQHTPDPPRALAALPPLLRPGGRLAITVYERRRWTKLNAKYLVRPVTRRVPHKWLLRGIKATMPVLWPVTEVLYRIPKVGYGFRFAIPVANYVEKKELTWRQRYKWAVLDTFDMLSPAYDDPQTEGELRAVLDRAGMRDVRRLPNPGANLVATAGGA